MFTAISSILSIKSQEQHWAIPVGIIYCAIVLVTTDQLIERYILAGGLTNENKDLVNVIPTIRPFFIPAVLLMLLASWQIRTWPAVVLFFEEKSLVRFIQFSKFLQIAVTALSRFWLCAFTIYGVSVLLLIISRILL